jgi:hypothetical protein
MKSVPQGSVGQVATKSDTLGYQTSSIDAVFQAINSLAILILTPRDRLASSRQIHQ